jgi:hypothetical protein
MASGSEAQSVSDISARRRKSLGSDVGAGAGTEFGATSGLVTSSLAGTSKTMAGKPMTHS